MNILFLLLSLSSAWAVDYTLDKETGKARPHYIGEVRQFKGKVFRLSEKVRKQVAEGTQFYKDDSLVTEEKSIVKLVLVDDTVMTIGPNSEIKFEEFEFKSKTERRIHSFVRGQITGLVKNKAADGDLQVKTPNAVMGVRGTQFAVNHRMVNGLEISEFALLEGSVVVTDTKNKSFKLGRSDKIVIVRDPKREELGHEERVLDKAEMDYLESEDKSFGPEFSPFLPFFDPQNASQTSGLYVYLNPKGSAAVNSSETPAVRAEPKGSFDNLKKLNDQLKNKKR